MNDRLRRARRALREHSDECPLWDYEANNCETCDRLEHEVDQAKIAQGRMMVDIGPRKLPRRTPKAYD